MLRHMLENPDDWVGAFRKLPNNLQLMTVHALQSVVFNKTIEARINNGISLSSPIPGDIVGRIDDNGQLETSSIVTVEEEHSRGFHVIANSADLQLLHNYRVLEDGETNR